ncbi:MAG: flagellar hook-associated protein FlgL [Treponema sp.]|nr:flagellar hook-associated protein FlgL [Treponema sp.]
MRRVSTDLMNNDMQFWMRRGERDIATLETQMATQKKITQLRDDPLGAARAVRYDSVVERLKKYEDNAHAAADQIKLSEGYARNAVDIMQRIREIAVQGANGIYTKDDQKAMAVEVDQLLKELVSIGNSHAPDGTFLFAGEDARTEPFRAVEDGSSATGETKITAVQYLGGWGGPKVQVSDSSYIPLRQPGSEVFGAERGQVISTFDARNWKATDNGAIAIDGVKVEIMAGDTVQALAAKINASGAAVHASIDPRSFSLALEATMPHQMRLEDLPPSGAGAGFGTATAAPGAATGTAGSVAAPMRPLVELGILAPTGRPPYNLAPSARSSGGSLFDVVMKLRDSLDRGDVLQTGGSALAGIDAGLSNLNRRVTEIGARSERLDFISARLNQEVPDATKLLSNETDLDITKAITDYRMLQYAHQASLQFAGKVFPQTLLDFLR